MENNFKILAREEGVKTDNLKKILSPLGEVEVILDTEGDIQGYTGMTGKWNNNTTAWDILFKDLKEEYTWVIEDDVAFNEQTIKNILNRFAAKEADLISNWIRTKHEHVYWVWWHLNDHFKSTELWCSLNCFCRISPSLIKKVKQYRDRYNKFLFHEMLLPSLAKTKVDFREDQFEGYFENSNFNWREATVNLNTIVGNKVYHPVKSDEKHTEICYYE
jgi:hypothetical protein